MLLILFIKTCIQTTSASFNINRHHQRHIYICCIRQIYENASNVVDRLSILIDLSIPSQRYSLMNLMRNKVWDWLRIVPLLKSRIWQTNAKSWDNNVIKKSRRREARPTVWSIVRSATTRPQMTLPFNNVDLTRCWRQHKHQCRLFFWNFSIHSEKSQTSIIYIYHNKTKPDTITAHSK